jgi:STE24 endopeptidase
MIGSPTTADRIDCASPEIKRYSRLKHYALFASVGVSLACVVVMGLWIGPVLDEPVKHWIGDSPWLRLVGVALLFGMALEGLSLPISFWSGFILEHRFGLSNQTLLAWAWKRCKAYLVGGPLALVLILGLYALLWNTGRWWWLFAAGGYLLVTLVLGRLAPVLILPLFYKTTRLDNPELLDRLRKRAEGTGLNIKGVYRLHLSAETKKANAALTGLGKSRRVLLGDTLLDGYTPEEIEVVFAHELGHHVHRHLIKLTAIEVLLTVAGLWLVDVVLPGLAAALGYPAWSDPAALPLLVLVLTLFNLVLMPAENALSRAFERQCDRYALEQTGRPEAFRSVFQKLIQQNKSDPDPHPVIVWLFHDHPTIRERLALAHHP